jgi:hypothetical protein
VGATDKARSRAALVVLAEPAVDTAAVAGAVVIGVGGGLLAEFAGLSGVNGDALDHRRLR